MAENDGLDPQTNQSAIASSENLTEIDVSILKENVAVIPDRVEMLMLLRDLLQTLGNFGDILQEVQQELLERQVELEALSDATQELREAATVLSTFEYPLEKRILELVIPPTVVKAVLEPTDQPSAQPFRQALEYLRDHRAKPAATPVFTSLVRVASRQCRDLILRQLRLFSTQINIPQQQAKVLKETGLCMTVLTLYQPEDVRALAKFYEELVGEIYETLFTTYLARVSKLEASRAAADLLGRATVAKTKDIAASQFSLVVTQARQAVLRRQLHELSPPLRPEVASQHGQSFDFALLLRYVLEVVTDTCSNEVLFCASYFEQAPGHTSARLAALLSPPLLRFMLSYAADCLDCIGLLLVIRVVKFYQHLAMSRALALGESLFEPALEMLWARFAQVTSIHCESITGLPVPPYQSPHYVARRFAELAVSLRFLNQDSPHPSIGFALLKLRFRPPIAHPSSAVVSFLGATAAAFLPLQRLIFLINNHDLVLGLWEPHIGLLNEEEVAWWRDKLAAYVSEFVELALLERVPGIIAVLKEIEPLLRQGHAPPARQLLLLPHHGQLFFEQHKEILRELSHFPVSSFSNLNLALATARVLLTQLLMYYHRFHEVVLRCDLAGPWLLSPEALAKDVDAYMPTS